MMFRLSSHNSRTLSICNGAVFTFLKMFSHVRNRCDSHIRCVIGVASDCSGLPQAEYFYEMHYSGL